jgi:hypothetical protein
MQKHSAEWADGWANATQLRSYTFSLSIAGKMPEQQLLGGALQKCMAIGMKRNRTYSREESREINGSLRTVLAFYIALRDTVSHSLPYRVAEAGFTAMETYRWRGFQILMGPTASRIATIMGNTASFTSLP